ncbi:MAG: PEP-CTERM system histidine kinase PrsK [Gammaproteobacteria bacterium]|nr:PEP-CTERM system histidine kinase PrsK [Gammaproteobacteria bacterium]
MNENWFSLPVISSFFATVAYLALSILLLAGYRGGRLSLHLLLAGSVSTLWFGAHIYYYLTSSQVFGVAALQIGEVARDATWFMFLTALLQHQQPTRIERGVRWGSIAALAAAGLLGAYLLLMKYTAFTLGDAKRDTGAMLAGFLGLTVLGLVLVEQLYRNTDTDRRWNIRYLCIGISAFLAYDFVMYVDALLFNRVNPDFWIARGAINAVAVPLIAISAARNRDWNTNLFVSRRVVFHSGTIFLAGAYLLLIAGAGYYFQAYGGSWGGALRIVATFAGLVGLVALLFSSTLRRETQRFIATHFYRNKYEYGEEWRKFTHRLSAVGSDDPGLLKTNIIAAIGHIMQSPGGLLWERDDQGGMVLTARWKTNSPPVQPIPMDHPCIARIAHDEWVIDLADYTARRAITDAVALPPAFLEPVGAWLLVPLFHDEELVGIVILLAPQAPPSITLEDVELLRTVGRQAASYLVLLRITEHLADARQFETYSKLSAFLVHDLKNVIAQLSLIQKNAVKHKHNPEFVEDAFNTIDAAVSRMNHMLAGLRQNQKSPARHSPVDLEVLAKKVVQHRQIQEPVPTLRVEASGVFVLGDGERLASVMEHLVQNAQDATPSEGQVEVVLSRSGHQALVTITDTGVGMDREFIDKRLFRPFDSTKGNAGMGIGVYESRDVVHQHGGRLDVTSQPGTGTSFTISLPLFDEQSNVVNA